MILFLQINRNTICQFDINEIEHHLLHNKNMNSVEIYVLLSSFLNVLRIIVKLFCKET